MRRAGSQQLFEGRRAGTAHARDLLERRKAFQM